LSAEEWKVSPDERWGLKGLDLGEGTWLELIKLWERRVKKKFEDENSQKGE